MSCTTQGCRRIDNGDCSGNRSVGNNPQQGTPFHHIQLRLDGDSTDPYQAVTLYEAVEKAKDLSPSFTYPVEIRIYAGTYYESKAIDIDVDLIHLIGISSYYGCRFILTEEVGDAWITVNSAGLELVNLYMDCQQFCDYVVRLTSSTAGNGCDFNQYWFLYGRIANMIIDGGLCYTNLGLVSCYVDQPYAFYIDNGAFYEAVICTVFVDDIVTDTIYFYVDNGSYLQLTHDIADGGTNFLNVQNASTVEIYQGRVFDFTEALHLETGSRIISRGVTMNINTSINNAFDDTCLWVSLSDDLAVENLDISLLNENNSSLSFIDESLSSQRGLHILGNLTVGDIEFPSNSYFGNGGSNMQHMYVQTYSGSVYTDHTADVHQGAGVVTTLFAGTTAGNILYVGDDQRFSSLLFDVSTALTIGAGTIVNEYWNGSAWTAFNYMWIQFNSPYTTYANSQWSVAETQTIRFDNALLSASSTWASTTVNGVDRYWVRFRISVGITTRPAINYLKNFYNSSLVKQDGTIFHYGLARTIINYPYDINLAQAAGTTPTNQDIYFSTKLYIGRTHNSFGNNRAIAAAFFVPSNIDSSCPITIKFAFSSQLTTASQVAFTCTLDVANVGVGDTVSITSPGTVHANEQTLNFTLTPNQTNGRFLVITSVSFYLPTVKGSNASGDVDQLIAFRFARAVDTNPTNMILTQLDPYYTIYKTTQIAVA